MLARYKIHRGKLPPNVRLPDGIRQDTRKHTKHCLRPTEEIVEAYLANPTDDRWQQFEQEYLALVGARFQEDHEPFETLAGLAAAKDVYLGCSCPTAKNPDVQRCHTVLALQFMQRNYPQLDVRFP